MAYGDKYELLFESNRGTKYQILISEDGYGGSKTSIKCAGNPITISYPVANNIYSPIRGSVARVNLTTETGNDFQYQEFFTATFGTYKMTLKDRDASLILWTGYNTSEMYSEEYRTPPYNGVLTFTDGLAQLKNIDFDGDNQSTGQMHLIEIIRRCTNQLPTQLNIFESFNVYTSAMNSTTSDSALAQTYTAASNYIVNRNKRRVSMSAYEVLEKVLTSIGCSICQAAIPSHASAWWIVRNKELDGSSLVWRAFAAAVGSESGTATSGSGTYTHNYDMVKVTAASGTDVVMRGNGHVGLNKKIELWTYIYNSARNYYINNNVLLNGSFDFSAGIDSTENLPVGWVRGSGLTTAECGVKSINSHERGMYPPRRGGFHINPSIEMMVEEQGQRGEQNLSLIMRTTQTAFDGTKYIELTQTGVVVDGGIYVPFIDFIPNGGASEWRFTIEFKNETTGNLWYLHESGGSPFTTVSTQIATTSPASSNGQEIRWHLANKYLVANTPSGLNTITTGDTVTIRMRIVLPVAVTSGDELNIEIKNAGILYAQSDGSEMQNEIIYTSEISSDKSQNEVTLEAYHSDGLNDVSPRSLRHSDVTITGAWARRGEVESLNIWEWLEKDYLDVYSKTMKRLSAMITTQTGTHHITLLNRIDTTVTGKSAIYDMKYALLGYTWQVIDDDYSIEAQEIDTLTYVTVANTSLSTSGQIKQQTTPPPTPDTGFPTPITASAATTTATTPNILPL